MDVLLFAVNPLAFDCLRRCEKFTVRLCGFDLRTPGGGLLGNKELPKELRDMDLRLKPLDL